MAEREPAGIGRRQFVQAGAVTGAALLGGGSLVTAAEASDPAMGPGMTAEEVVKLLDLQPNATCGFVRVTFISPLAIAPGGLPAPFANGRPLGSALYFLVTPTAPVRLHRIRNGQLYHYYLGDPLEVFMLHEDGTTEHVVVGPDLRSGQQVQLHIPGNTFHTARLPARAPGSSAAAPSGRAWCRPRTSRSATSMRSRPGTPRSRPTCGRSPPRCGTSSRPAARGRPRWLHGFAWRRCSRRRSSSSRRQWPSAGDARH